ncbi:hypothetical protein [Gimesia sp.]|uniref:hypothetical protein n=1 Tax=Gimesia sp. TaxID=2024833 RepID=UPI000C5ED61B|nr:hypothetical protein [Gimesia sp.]MAX39484.1 hypothetical protein [Gimesia sp.]HAH46689.1 hypothetical protein [Planctomycetaceae bacterium]HBL46275.1 hypothetical protein [Planctomycetaceae bacterium]
MADFRLEKLYVILDEPIPGINHLQAVDPEEFAWHDTFDLTQQLGVTPLDDFTYAPFDREVWYPAGAGLKSIRSLLQEFRRQAATSEEVQQRMQPRINMFEKLEELFDQADAHDREFYLSARDLD